MLSPITLGGGYEKRFQKTSFMCVTLNLVISAVESTNYIFIRKSIFSISRL